MSDEDYVLHGGPPPPAPEPEPQPLDAEELAEPVEAATALPPSPEPPAPEPETPEPEAAQPTPPARAPEPAPVRASEPEPSPPPEPAAAMAAQEAGEQLSERPSDQPADEPAPEPLGLEPAQEEPKEEPPKEPEEEPWPEQVQPPPAAEPAAAAPAPLPGPAKAPSALSGWRERLSTLGPQGRLLLIVAAVLVAGVLAYRTGLIGGRADPEGARRITFTGISGYFLKNDHDGVIYVVQGLARNGYGERRGRIRIKAALYDGAGKQVDEKLVYAGNSLSREDLQRIPLKEIVGALAAPAKEGSHSVVRPGATAPFMAVFGNLPNSLGEFSVEAAGSSRDASS